jgi:hypothetical protein
MKFVCWTVAPLVERSYMLLPVPARPTYTVRVVTPPLVATWTTRLSSAPYMTLTVPSESVICAALLCALYTTVRSPLAVRFPAAS